MTDISTIYVVFIFRIKVRRITSVDGVKLWLLIWLVNEVAMLLVICQLSRTRSMYIVLSQLNSRLLLVKLLVVQSFCHSYFWLSLSISHLYGDGNS